MPTIWRDVDVGGAVAICIDDIGAHGADPVGFGQSAGIGINVVGADGQTDLVNRKRGSAVGMEGEVARAFARPRIGGGVVNPDDFPGVVIDVVDQHLVQTKVANDQLVVARRHGYGVGVRFVLTVCLNHAAANVLVEVAGFVQTAVIVDLEHCDATAGVIGDE